MQKEEEELNLTKRVVPPHLNPESKKNLFFIFLALMKDIDPKSVKLGSRDALEYVSWLV